MGNLNNFNVLCSFIKEEDFKKNLDEIDKISSEINYDDLSFKKINRLIYLHEIAAVSYRRLLQEKEINELNEVKFFNKKDIKVKDNDLDSLKGLPVSVATIATEQGQILCFHSPLTFKRGLKESFILANYLNVLMHKMIKDNLLDLSHIGQKKIVYAIRVANKFNHGRHCDNDNLELSELINVVFSNLISSDNPLKMSVVSEFLESSNEALWGVHLVVVPYDLPMMKAQKMLEFINEKTTNFKAFI